MANMRAQRAAAAPGVFSYELAVPGAPPAPKMRALFIGPDGEPRELDLQQDVLLEWGDRECAQCAECEDGLCEECAEVLECAELQGLGQGGTLEAALLDLGEAAEGGKVQVESGFRARNRWGFAEEASVVPDARSRLNLELRRLTVPDRAITQREVVRIRAGDELLGEGAPPSPPEPSEPASPHRRDV
jgi:hypothetical protein